MPQGGAGGQNLRHLRFSFSTSFSDTQCLFLDVALLVQISMGSLFLHLMTIGGKQCALITSVDKPSRVPSGC